MKIFKKIKKINNIKEQIYDENNYIPKFYPNYNKCPGVYFDNVLGLVVWDE